MQSRTVDWSRRKAEGSLGTTRATRLCGKGVVCRSTLPERTPGNVAPKRPTLQSSASHAKDSKGGKQEERIVAATVIERTEVYEQTLEALYWRPCSSKGKYYRLHRMPTSCDNTA